MVEKPGKKGGKVHLCANESCRHKETVAASEKETDE